MEAKGMNDMEIAQTAYRKVMTRALLEDFRGFDPYDGSNSRYPFLQKGKTSRLVQTYFHKFSPVNLRPFAGVEKRMFPQASAKFILAALTESPDAGDPGPWIEPNVSCILDTTLENVYGKHCWNGNNMGVQGVREYQSPTTPGIVGTVTCMEALIALQEAGRGDVSPVIRSARDFLLEELWTEFNGIGFFKYKPITPPWLFTHNTTMLAAGAVFKANRLLGERTGLARAERAIDEVVRRQWTDGSWDYAEDLRTGESRRQLDFHQGFILDVLADVMAEESCFDRHYDAYRKGLEFYDRYLFDEYGRGYYRRPRRWPVNIQNQGQGVFTFVRATAYDQRYLERARRIARWTIGNMQAGDGGFYFLKYPLFTNKTNYLRWNDAYMAHPLAALLAAEREGSGAIAAAKPVDCGSRLPLLPGQPAGPGLAQQAAPRKAAAGCRSPRKTTR